MTRKIVKDAVVFVFLSLATAGLYMVLRTKTDIKNKEYVALLFLMIGIIVFVFKSYKISVGSIIYSVLIFLVLATLVDVYPSVGYFIQYSLVIFLSFLFHRFLNKTEVS